ncbi:Flp pilus assembly complex ATPase component TadA, partial [bacterium]|nr:Flp pilus assembly complex ATPase component TadA [candidate division CSSED10-310 bacterium]
MNSSPESAEKSSGSRVKSGFLMHLHRKGIIYLDERNALLSQCSTKGLYIEDLLEYLDLPEREVYERLAEFCGLPLLDINQLFVSTELLSMIPAHELRQMMILPMYLVNEELTIACAMPLEQKSMLHLKKNTGLNHFIQVLVPFSELTSLLDQYLSDDDRGAGVQSIIARLHDQIALGISEKHGVDETSLPIIPLVNAILESALKAGASDIHFEPRENVYAVRFRIDGQLQEMFSLPQMAQDAVIARLKVISNLNIIERYRPQDGQITIPYKNKTIEFRINFLRTVWGEKACLRILDRESVRVQLLTLGLENDNQLPLIMDLCKRPNGLIIVCGATGSGKSTTLFSMLNEINTEDVNIVTVEDPSEYRIDRINQCSVIKERGLDFHSALKAILRQDPDIIMLGEIRDLETAEIA